MRAQQEAREQRIDSIQDRVGADSRDILLRFGRARAFGGPSGGAASDNPLLSNAAAGMFADRRIELLRGLGRL